LEFFTGRNDFLEDAAGYPVVSRFSDESIRKNVFTKLEVGSKPTLVRGVGFSRGR
jgi:hypothetical protein